jgi:hypothetical protein
LLIYSSGLRPGKNLEFQSNRQICPYFPDSLKRPEHSLAVREINKKITGSNIHDVTILHNIKLMREPVSEKYRKFRKRHPS